MGSGTVTPGEGAGGGGFLGKLGGFAKNVGGKISGAAGKVGDFLGGGGGGELPPVEVP